MKKIIVTLTLASLVTAFSPAMPQAQAAFVENNLAQMLVQDKTASQFQELLNLRDKLKQGNKDELWGILAKSALERAGIPAAVSDVAAGNIGGNIIETILRDEIQSQIGAKVAPYQKEIDVLAALLNLNKTLNPAAARNNNSLAGAPENYRQILNMTATAYAPGPLDNGRWNDKTYIGTKVRKGVAAVDPRVIPMGTKLWVEGYGEAIAEDQGRAIKGDRIDLAFDDRQQALAYGIQNVKVYVLE